MPDKQTREYFVGIEDSGGLQRDLLESLRGVIKSLQALYRIRLIRKEKDLAILELRKLVRDTLAEFQKLRVELPKIRAQKPVVCAEPPPKREPPKQKPSPQETEISKLASDL